MPGAWASYTAAGSAGAALRGTDQEERCTQEMKLWEQALACEGLAARSGGGLGNPLTGRPRGSARSSQGGAYSHSPAWPTRAYPPAAPPCAAAASSMAAQRVR